MLSRIRISHYGSGMLSLELDTLTLDLLLDHRRCSGFQSCEEMGQGHPYTCLSNTLIPMMDCITRSKSDVDRWV